MSYTLEDLEDKFGCDHETAKNIEKLIKEIAVEGLEEKIEKEVPF